MVSFSQHEQEINAYKPKPSNGDDNNERVAFKVMQSIL